MNWTKEQKSAIEDEGGTLLISAAAGSGKTAVLVERAVRILTQEDKQVLSDRLLIVTFTRAAAGELRARIASRLAEIQAASPQNMYIRRQILLLGRANICTIDAFCMQLLKQYFMRANLPPDFDMADMAKSDSMRQDALAEVLEQLYVDADFCEFAAMYGRSRSDATAVGALMRLARHLESTPFPKAALRNMCKDWQGDAPLSATKWGTILQAQGISLIDSALAIENAAYAAVNSEEALANYQGAFEDDISYLDAMRALLMAKEWDEAVSKARSYVPARLKPVRGFEGNLIDTVKALRDKAKTLTKDLCEKVLVCTEAEFSADRARTSPMLEALARGAGLLSDTLMRIKLEQKSLEFYDVEQLALQLLCNESYERSELSLSVAAGFDAVMVDEYQDTNELQSLLYTCLANKDESNLFLVGDIKQCIYHFRQAQPEIFMAKKEAYNDYDTRLHPAVLTLDANFRSAGGVIGEINHIFSVLMSRSLGGVDYSDSERLNVGVSDTYASGGLELALIDTPSGVPAADAEYIADTIDKMVKDGFIVRDKDTQRPCNHGDFCILLRTRANFAVYSAAIEARDIKVFADADAGLLRLPEVSPLLSLLRVIDNPVQDVHLTAVMLSLLYDFTPAMLMRLREASRKTSMYAALLHDASEPSRRLVSDLSAYRRLAVACSCEELYWEVFARTRYFEKIGAVKQGSEKRDNVRAFVAYVNTACSGSGGIAGFLRMLDASGEDITIGSSSAPVAEPNTVSIMTIHRSKGLEFPVVILADVQHGFNTRDASEVLLAHNLLGAALTLSEGDTGLYRSAPHIAIGTAMRAESISEEMRILYVALTRAKDKLIITIPMSDCSKMIKDLAITLAGTGGANPTMLASAASFAPWICTAALMHPDCDNLRELAGGIIVPVLSTDSHMHAKILAYVEPSERETMAQAIERVPAEKELVRRLCAGFASERAEQATRTDIPAKISVSRLVHARAEQTPAKPSFAYEKGASGAQKGTALHAFMQYADYAAAARELDSELERLVREEYIEPVIAELLDKKAIAAFFDSPLAARMLSCNKLLREYDFITAIPPQKVLGENANIDINAKGVLLQGIADAVIVTGDTAEIVDYKTDKVANEEALIERYAPQLRLYKEAIAARLGVKISALTIYSFALSHEINIE